MAALGCGWAAGNGAWKCAAKLGGMEVLNLLLEMYDPRDGAWRKWGDRGDGIFAAAAEAGHTDILKLLIVEGCYKDQMGLKALEVAVESGSAVILECCYSTDLGRDEDGYILNEQFVAAEAIATPPLQEAMAGRDFGMVQPLSRFLWESGGWMEAQVRCYAKDGDLEMLLCLEEMIMCVGGRHENLFLDTF